MKLPAILLGYILYAEVSALSPPIIVTHPSKEYWVPSDTSVEIKCIATGDPPVEYSWKKDGAALDENTLKINKLDNGTFEIRQFNGLYEGNYQCFAKNTQGTAISHIASVKKAYLRVQGTGSSAVKEYTAKVGESLKIDCMIGDSAPPPTFSWTAHEDAPGGQTIDIKTEKRVQIDLEGNLHFANVLRTDAQNGWIYKCKEFNAILQQTSSGSSSKLIVQVGVAENKLPVKAYATNDTTAVGGKSVQLQCIFYGFPTPSVTWTRDGSDLPANRHKIMDGGNKLEITNVKEEDEGKYICTASNSEGNVEHQLELEVEFTPVFEGKATKPQVFDKVEDDEAEFYCETKGDPDAKVQWYINGKPVTEDDKDDEMGPDIDLDDDDTKLTIENLCNDCSNKSATFTVQCNASNAHGYVMTQGYVNVFYGEEEPSSILPIIIGVAVAVAILFIVIILIVVVIMMIKKRKKSSKGEYQVPTTQDKADEL